MLTIEDGPQHKPVLAADLIRYLGCSRGSTICDCTAGGGGHSRAVLEEIAPGGFLIGIDQDRDALEIAASNLAQVGGQFQLICGDFVDLGEHIKAAGFSSVDGIYFDLGFSSYQVEDPERGFSYKRSGPLDMRMSMAGVKTAADIVNSYGEKELATVISRYGEEKWASRIAKFIVAARSRAKIETTTELASIIKKALPASVRRRGPHPARRTFQALRIEVNSELDKLKKALNEALAWLATGGRLVVISYHSLEDRIVKNTFRSWARGCVCPPELPKCACGFSPLARILTNRVVKPTAAEIADNPRADSARLRAIEKL